jgi:hypothetical protein
MKLRKMKLGLLKEGTQWVAVNLGTNKIDDAFLVAQGSTKEEAIESFRRTYHAMAMTTNGPMRERLARCARTPAEYTVRAEEFVDIEVDAFDEKY